MLRLPRCLVAVALAAASAGASLDLGPSSPWSLSLDRFVDKLMRDHSLYFPNSTVAEAAVGEYRRFLYMQQRFPEHHVAASKLVDLVWHEHIVDTKSYMADCQRLFGRYLHHYPCFGAGRPFHHQREMVKAYEETFGEWPREDVWEIPSPAPSPLSFPGCPAPPPTPPIPCPAPPPAVMIKVQSTKSTKEELCIDAGNELGATMTVQRCNESASWDEQSQWFDETYSHLAIGDVFYEFSTARCAELPDGDATNGRPLVMNCCANDGNKSAHQHFALDRDSGKIMYMGALRSTATQGSKCVDAGNMVAGNQLVIWDCDDVERQHWVVDYELAVTAPRQQPDSACAGGSLGSCIDLCPREDALRACVVACMDGCQELLA